MIETLALGAYRRVMSTAARVAGAVARVPGAPAGWRAVRDRLGRLGSDERAMAASASAVWIHAASVGELNAVRPLLTRLKERFPERLYVVSTLTRTGLALARQLPEPHLTFLLPIDAPITVRRLLQHFRLEVFLFTETEIWPTLLTELAAAGVPTLMVSGRVSVRSAARARCLRPLYRAALADVTCCMQTEDDAGRIVALGADPRRVRVAGSLKSDAAVTLPSAEVTRVGAALGVPPRRLVVAGSTHAGEDEILLDVYHRLGRLHPELLLMLAPRHPERLPAVSELVRAQGLPLLRYSTLAAGEGAVPTGPAVVLLDVVGPLADCYTLGVVAFVGGSLVPVGGHNVLEPARAGRPVVVGPHTENAGETVDRLVAGGAALRVRSPDALALALEGLLAEPGRAAEMGRRARSLALGGQGAVEHHLKIIAARLSSASFAHARAP